MRCAVTLSSSDWWSVLRAIASGRARNRGAIAKEEHTQSSEGTVFFEEPLLEFRCTRGQRGGGNSVVAV